LAREGLPRHLIGYGFLMELKQVEPYIWEVPIGWVDGMRVPGRIFGSESLVKKAQDDRAIDQVANVATLPGIVGASLAMPDIHWGYGFPIGGVAATNANDGAISPGGVGFDIGCGVRLLRSDISWKDAAPRLHELVKELGKVVPRGVGSKGRMRLTRTEIDRVLVDGVFYPLSTGIGWEDDAELAEDGGKIPGAEPEKISERAKERGAPQLGSLGAGNHFLEVQVVDEIRDARAADAMGIYDGQVCVMIHSGSRGVGHQACQDYVRDIDSVMRSLGIEVPDRQLACAPLDHPTARDYLGAMNAAGNFARANRHLLADAAREAFGTVFGSVAKELGMSLVYDVSHNLAKMESYEVEGKAMPLCVHRKGATRSFGPGHPALPSRYRDIGQPVIKSFGSTCHGAGRAMSRTQAKKVMSGQDLKRELEGKGIVLAGSKWKLLSEEAPYAYKDVSEVVESCEGAGISKVVARLHPVGVVKG
jgi:tRNA-splicing ligase RtcB